MKNNEFIIKKIPVKYFLECLDEVYDNGADFVDLFVKLGPGRDAVGIVVNEEYIHNSTEVQETKISSSFTEEDINQLI